MKGDKLINMARIAAKENNFEEAYQLLKRAMEYGNPEAIYAIGTWYLHGVHLEKDLEKSIKFFQLACDANFPAACFDLACSYEKGMGVDENLEVAFQTWGELNKKKIMQL